MENKYFLLLIEVLKKYDTTFDLRVNGFKDVLKEYQGLSYNTSREVAFEISKKLNVWIDYFSDVSQYFQNEYLFSENEKNQIQSIKSIENSEKASSGERFANTTFDLLDIRLKRSIYKSMYDLFSLILSFLEKAFYQCKFVYSKNNDILTFSEKNYVDYCSDIFYIESFLSKIEKFNITNIEFPKEKYITLVNRYRDIQIDDNKPYVFKLSKQINLLCLNLLFVTSYVEYLYLESDSYRKQEVAIQSTKGSDKVSVGDRYANTTTEVITIKNKNITLKSFYELLINKYHFLDKAFYQCRNIYIVENISEPQ